VPPRLTSSFWVKAYIRRCYGEDMPAVVVRHGDDTAGAVLIKVNLFDAGCRVFQRTTDLDGNQAWMEATGDAPVPETEADAYIERQGGYDPDLWVVEVESRDGRHLLDEPMI
jgi:hypothetical protein